MHDVRHRVFSRRLSLAASPVLLALLSCAAQGETDIEADAVRLCQLIVECYDVPQPEERYFRTCVWDIDYNAEISVGERGACLPAFAGLVSCMAGLDCERYDEYVLADRTVPKEYPCRDEEAEFAESCRRTWNAGGV